MGPLPCGERDLAYALAFAPAGARRISYAASFGEQVFPDGDKDAFAGELRQYSSLLVRDCASADLLARWGLPATRVLDPTLLLGAGEWRRFAEPVRDERFVLAYQIHGDPRVGRYAARVAERMGLPLVRVSCALHQIARPGSLRWLPTLGQLVLYLDKAALVVTDSFHGTAFCANLNTPFVSVPIPGETPVRIGDLLGLVGLESRLLSGEDDVALAETPINWEAVNRIVAEERRRSLDALARAVERPGGLS